MLFDAKQELFRDGNLTRLKKPSKIEKFPKEGCKECVKEMYAVGPTGFPKNNCGFCGARLR